MLPMAKPSKRPSRPLTLSACFRACCGPAVSNSLLNSHAPAHRALLFKAALAILCYTTCIFCVGVRIRTEIPNASPLQVTIEHTPIHLRHSCTAISKSSTVSYGPRADSKQSLHTASMHACNACGCHPALASPSSKHCNELIAL